MLNRLLSPLTPPTNLADDNDNRAWLMRAILFPTILVTLLAGFIDPSLGGLRLAVVALIAVEGLVLVLLLLRKVMAASVIFILAAWLTILFLAYRLGGMQSAVLYFSIVILLLAGILIGPRFALFFLFINLLTVTAFLVLENRDLLPAVTNPTTPLRRWAVYVGTYILVSVIVHLGLVTNRKALQETREKEALLSQSNQELEDIRANLEEHINERTAALERRAAQIRAAAEFGRAAVSLHSQEKLLSRAVDLISEKFGFYHAGIFLLDSKGEYAVLRAANSPGGQRMLARNHKLHIGETGIVGYVTANRAPHITQEVGADATYFDNPDLPETRSEMALPLQVGDIILGALDVQSTEVNAFTPEDVLAMQVVADQLAVAIQNARLLEEQQSALDAARRAYREISQESWKSFLERRNSIGYLANPGSMHIASRDLTPEMQSALMNEQPVLEEETLSLPIKIRSNTTGVLRLKKGSNAAWKAKEIEFIQEVAEQISQALEAARLFNETQQRAERERLTSEIVNRMRTTNDPQSIMQTALAELRQALGVRKAQVVLENGSKLAVSDGNGHVNEQEQTKK